MTYWAKVCIFFNNSYAHKDLKKVKAPSMIIVLRAAIDHLVYLNMCQISASFVACHTEI